MLENAAVLLDKMSGFDFEELVADILKRLGYGHIEKILFTQDGGRDILIHSPEGFNRGRMQAPAKKQHWASSSSKATLGCHYFKSC